MNTDIFDYIKKHAGELRMPTFLRCAQLAIERGARIIVETGTYRGIPADGYSTPIFAMLANELGASFFSVDNCQAHVDKSRECCGELSQYVTHICSDSLAFLSAFDSCIDVLYLDSYDYSFESPQPSQLHQVAELGGAWSNLTDNSLILLDDCNIQGGGKAGLSDPFLKERGWHLVVDSYQKLYSKV